MAFELKGQLRSDPTSCSITDWLASLLSNTFLLSLINFVEHKMGTKKQLNSANSVGQWTVQAWTYNYTGRRHLVHNSRMSMKKLTLVLFTIFLVSSSQLAYASLASILFTFTTHMWLAVFADWRNKSLPHFSTSHFLLSKRGHNSLEAIKEKTLKVINGWM